MATRWFQRLLLGAVLVTTAGAAAGGVATLRSDTVDAAGGQCSNLGLSITPMRTSGATGHIGEMFRIHKVTAGACTLYGYPGAVLLDGNFNSYPTHVSRGLGFLAGKRAPVTVRLDATHDAYFILEWDHIPSPGQSCPGAKYVLITPPNDRLPVVTYAGKGSTVIDACGGLLTASPVAPTAFSF